MWIRKNRLGAASWVTVVEITNVVVGFLAGMEIGAQHVAGSTGQPRFESSNRDPRSWREDCCRHHAAVTPWIGNSMGPAEDQLSLGRRSCRWGIACAAEPYRPVRSHRVGAAGGRGGPSDCDIVGVRARFVRRRRPLLAMAGGESFHQNLLLQRPGSGRGHERVVPIHHTIAAFRSSGSGDSRRRRRWKGPSPKVAGPRDLPQLAAA